MNVEPIAKTKEELAEIINLINHPDSPVGIDAQFTHAIIIACLQQISNRLDNIEAKLAVNQ